jgi:hypothetical protein
MNTPGGGGASIGKRGVAEFAGLWRGYADEEAKNNLPLESCL